MFALACVVFWLIVVHDACAGVLGFGFVSDCLLFVFVGSSIRLIV